MSSQTRHIPLNIVDHMTSGYYACALFYIPLSPGVSPTQAFEILHEGLHRTFVQMPWLSGRLWRQSPDTPGHHPGQAEIRYEPVDPEGPRPYQLRFKQLELSEYDSYDELKENAFPTDAFPDEAIRWGEFDPDLRDGPEVFISQANFIPGGCVLAAALHHFVCDGVGSVTLWTCWGNHCKALQMDPQPPVVPPPPESNDRESLERLWLEHGRKFPSADGWRLMGRAPGDDEPDTELEPEDGAGRVMKSAIFYVSPAKLAALRKECEQAGADITGNDAIAALMWRGAIRARRAAAQKSATPLGYISNPDAFATAIITVDGRAYFKPEWLSPSYLGNLACVNMSVMPVARLTSPDTSIGSIARNVRESAKSVTAESLLDAYTVMKGVPDWALRKTPDLRLRNATQLISPMIGYPLSDMNFGDTIFGNGGSPDAMRIPMGFYNRTVRICIILPKLVSGGVEIQLNMFEEELELLKQDSDFIKYAAFLTT